MIHPEMGTFQKLYFLRIEVGQVQLPRNGIVFNVFVPNMFCNIVTRYTQFYPEMAPLLLFLPRNRAIPGEHAASDAGTELRC